MSGAANKIGLGVTTLVFIVAVTMIIVLSINSAPKAAQLVQDVTTPVDTVAIFNPYVAANASDLVMTADNIDRWGQAPGAAFNSTYTMDLTLTKFETVLNGNTGNGYRVNKTGEMTQALLVTYDMNSTTPVLDNITFGCDTCKRETIEVVPKFNYNVTDQADWKKTIETLNWGALTTWYKLTAAPKYSAAWRLLAQVTDKMYTQSFQTFYYGTILYETNFNDMATVLANELNVFTNVTEGEVIYNDTQYGMCNAKALTYWIGASLEKVFGEGTQEYQKEIQYHFSSIYGIVITDDDFDSIVTTGSALNLLIVALENQLIDLNLVNTTTTPISAIMLATTQWAERTLLGTTLDTLCGGKVMGIDSMLDLGMSFMVAPEFSNKYVFTQYEAQQLLDPSFRDDTTMLNPRVMYDNYFAELTGGNSTLMTQTQWSYFTEYMDEQIDAMNTYSGEGQLLAKSVELGYSVLNEALLVTYATRNLGHVINYGNGTTPAETYDCAHYVNLANNNDATQTATICAQFPFNTVAGVSYFVNSEWYNNKTNFMTTTGLSDSQYNTLFDVNTAGSFGYTLNSVLLDEQFKWSCAAANCTQNELAPLQYGKSALTMSTVYPIGEDTTFIPASYTIYNWGGSEVAGVAGPPEISAYLNYPYQSSTHPFSLDRTQVENMLASGYSWYGFQNNFNMMRLYSEYAPAAQKGIMTSTYWHEAATQIGISDSDLVRLIAAAQWQVIELLFEGLTKEYTLDYMVTPWQNTIANKINTGSLNRGNLYIDPLTTPVITNIFGPAARQSYTMLTGVNYDSVGMMYETPQTVGQIREIDDSNGYIWIRQALWTGEGADAVFWYDEHKGLQYTYDPSNPTTSQYNLKLSLQNSPQLQFASQMIGFSLDLFASFSLVQNEIHEGCFSDDCYQHTALVRYAEERSNMIGQAEDIQTVMNMPIQAQHGNNTAWFDAQTGYALGVTRNYQQILMTSDYFFIQHFATTDQPTPVTASISSRFAVNTTPFYNTLYPSNGTVAVPTGETETVDGPKGLRKPMQVVWISVSCMILVLSMVIFGYFAHAFQQEKNKEQAQQPLYSQLGGKTKGQIHINDTHESGSVERLNQL